MLQFPYGISDFEQVRRDDYFYIDRTNFIPTLESAGRQLLYLRPRRFGKSLLLSTLANYYDVARLNEFEQLFGALSVGKNPTSLHNHFFIMRWDFSGVQTFGNAEEIGRALYDHINGAIEQFIVRYRDILTYKIQPDPENAIRSFQSVLAAVQTTPYKLYLLIDEYDNFANEVLMSSLVEGQRRYEELVKGEGVFRTVFKAIKAASAGQGLERVFITGVSPVVMSDLSSAYNVATNIYLDPEFNTMCGFSEAEITTTLQEVAQTCNLSQTQVDEALEMMRTFYNGYCFSALSQEQVYNPTLTLYFLNALQKRCLYPAEMLDENLAMDRNRIAYISQLGGAEPLITTALSEQEQVTVSTLAQRFGVREVLVGEKSQEYLAALLYYLGVLTIAGRDPLQKYILKIPNLVVRELYVDRLRTLFLPKVKDQEAGKKATETLFLTGDLHPLCHFIEQQLFSTFDNRDYLAANELTVKTAFLTMLYNDLLYIVDSETTLERTYADLTLMRRPDLYHNPVLYDLLFEFKYVKLNDVKTKKGKEKDESLDGAAIRDLSLEDIKALPEVKAKLSEARMQLQGYQHTLKAHYGERLRLRTYAVVALGFDRLIWEAL